MITKALWIILKYLVIFFINKVLLLFIEVELPNNINLLLGFVSILLSFLSIKILFKLFILILILLIFNYIFELTTNINLLNNLYNIFINIPYKELLISTDFKKFKEVVLLPLLIILIIVIPLVIKIPMCDK